MNVAFPAEVPLLRSDELHPITDFVRHHKRHHHNLRETGHPLKEALPALRERLGMGVTTR